MSTVIPAGMVTGPPPPRPEWVHGPARVQRPGRKEAVVTAAAVAAGFGLALLLPAPQTPHRVAQAFTEARFDGDWAAAWALLCTSTRAATDFATFAEESAAWRAYYFTPPDVVVEVDDVQGVRGPAGPYVAVGLTVTSDEWSRKGWATGGELPLVEEDGNFRVCAVSTLGEF